ncbi:MAG: heat-inducible transcription repressor HrcA, partial [Firmicutes bacterium]|nr:heat-inducible transcription repressor HrcA [Bacillota bacterium]
MDISERQLRILQAIISDFISTGEPVGSRSLSKNHDINVSPATIRNEMSDLEEMGYLTHPHTSAGRVPSDKAYRLYVDGMMQKYELPEEEKKIITARLNDDFNEFEKTIKKAASLLSEITNLTSFAITPSQNADVLKYINVLPVDEETVVLMVVASSGRVTNTALKLTCPYNEENL